MTAAATADARDSDQRDRAGRFVSGNIGGPGRGKGSRNKLGEAFVEALHEDFVRHGPATIVEVRQTKPDAYLKVIASLMPKELRVSAVAELSEADLAQRARMLAEALGIEPPPLTIEAQAEAAPVERESGDDG